MVAALAMTVCAAADMVTLPSAPVYQSTRYPASGYTTSEYTASGYATTLLTTANRTAHGRPAVLRNTPLDGRGRRSVANGSPAEQTSTNWAGYATTGGAYTSVSANWTEPSVECTTRGVVAFWVGLDGWGSDSVEQDGTGVDCTSGSPVQFAWWETYPGNSIVQYDKPVAAGDRLSSVVTSEPGGEYAMVLTDSTQNWTETTRANVPQARDASAEIVTEAVTTGPVVSALPDFGVADFSDARIGTAVPQAANAQPIEMTDAAGDEIAATGPVDAGGDFAVDYVGRPGTAFPPFRRHDGRHGLK